MDYPKKRAKAQTLITKFGSTVSYTQGGQTYTSPAVATTRTKKTGNGELEERYLEIVFPGTVTPKPAAGATLLSNGIKFRIYEVEPVAPADVELVYKVRAR